MSRYVIGTLSTSRAEKEAAVAERGAGNTAGDHLPAQRSALMTRAAKRDVDCYAPHESREKQAAFLGFDVRALATEALRREETRDASRESGPGRRSGQAAGTGLAPAAVAWAVAHLSERE